MSRFTTVAVALTASALLSACVIAPPVNSMPDTAAVTRMSEQALATAAPAM